MSDDYSTARRSWPDSSCSSSTSCDSFHSPRPAPELLFEVFSQRYEGGSVLVTTNLPLDE